MEEFNIWVDGGTCPLSGFEYPELLRTPEPIPAESFDAAVQEFVDSLPDGQVGLWERTEDGVWTMSGRQVVPQSSALAEVPDFLEVTFAPGVPPIVGEELPVVPLHELWVDSTVVPEDTAAPAAMLTPEPIAAETFDDAVQIYIDHLGPAGEADKWEQDPEGQWAYKGCAVAADEQTALDTTTNQTLRMRP